MKRLRNIIFLLLMLPIAFLLDGFINEETAAAAPLRADAVVQEDAVYVGDPFTFMIRISGTDQPEPPDLSGLEGFSVHYQGGSQNNSSSITIINGEMTKNVTRGYVFSYQLTPKQTGRLTIPALVIRADGQTVQTRPVIVNVLEPETTDDVKLQLFLSRDHCYVGEPVVLTVTWYLRSDVRSFNFLIPLLEKTDWFHFIDPETDQAPGKTYYRIPLADGEVIGEQGKASLSGISYSTISFSKVLIPKKPGDLTIDPATVACEILDGYRTSRNQRSLAEQFFRGRQEIYKKVVVPSNGLRLNISDVPSTGKPAGFAGHIGEYEIFADATPVDVNVGDPITLTITLTGPDYIDHVTLPPLTSQAALTKDFKIPLERATGETRDKSRIFTQTLRALRPDVTQIPAIELPYFDTNAREYRIARTRPIPLTVKETRIITASDAEGRALPLVSGGEVETWTKGIAYNYEDLSVLKNQETGFSMIKSPAWMTGLMLPPGLYLMLLVTATIIRKKQTDPKTALARKAYSRLHRDLNKISHEESESAKTGRILDVLRQYLGARLGIASQAIVFADVYPLLNQKGVSDELLGSLKSIFEACEAGRYAGTSAARDASLLSEKTLGIAKELETLFK